MFEKAARLKLRFATRIGALTAEDLWDLPLESKTKLDLYGIGEALHKEVNELTTSGFRKQPTAASQITSLKLDIVKYIVEVKEKENAAKTAAASKKSRNEAIKAIIAKKEVSDLESKSTEELLALLED